MQPYLGIKTELLCSRIIADVHHTRQHVDVLTHYFSTISKYYYHFEPAFDLN